MRSPISATAGGRTTLALVLLLLFPAQWGVNVWSAVPAARQRPVWLVFFFSRTCPKCEPIRDLLDALKSTYPIRIKAFDIDKPEHYDLYRRLEAIHAKDSFAVPLVMLNNSILVGEHDISTKLERMVSRLSRKGGASLPYLGPDQRRGEALPTSAAKEPKSAPCDHCGRKGRPPTVQEEWKKIRGIIDRFF
jgi:glutaredoxin